MTDTYSVQLNPSIPVLFNKERNESFGTLEPPGSWDDGMDVPCISQTVNSKHEAHANRQRGEKTLLMNITLSAQQSVHCSVVRRPNPVLSLEERWRLLCFSILTGSWV